MANFFRTTDFAAEGFEQEEPAEVFPSKTPHFWRKKKQQKHQTTASTR